MFLSLVGKHFLLSFVLRLLAIFHSETEAFEHEDKYVFLYTILNRMSLCKILSITFMKVAVKGV